jgi:hypothetical protein
MARPKPKRGRARSTAPRNFWGRPGPKIAYGREHFRVTLLRGRRIPRLPLDRLIETVTWTDESAILTGDISLRQAPYVKQPIPVLAGHQVLCEIANSPNGPYRELWRMRVSQPQREFREGTASFSLQSDLALLQASEDDFRYGKGRRYKRGPRGDQVIRDVCRRYGVRVRSCPRMRHRVRKLVMLNVSPLDVIVRVLKLERTNHGRRFAIYFERGKLEIRPLRRSNLLLELGPSVINAALSDSIKENFATALTVRTGASEEKQPDSKNRKVKRKKKIVVKIKSPSAVARYGYIHRIVYAQDADTPGEAKAQGRRYLAKLARPNKEATISHRGIPWVKRLQAIRLSFPEQQVKQIVYVKSVRFSLTAQGLDMEMNMAFDDPYVDEKLDKVTEDLVEVAEKRGRTPPKKKADRKAQPERKKERPQPARAPARGTGKPPVLGQTPTPVRGK